MIELPNAKALVGWRNSAETELVLASLAGRVDAEAKLLMTMCEKSEDPQIRAQFAVWHTLRRLTLRLRDGIYEEVAREEEAAKAKAGR